MRSPHTFQQFCTHLSIPLLIHSCTVQAAGHLLSSIPLSPIIRLGQGLVTRQNITPTFPCVLCLGVFLVHFLRGKHCQSKTPRLWRPGGRGRQAPGWGGSRTPGQRVPSTDCARQAYLLRALASSPAGAFNSRGFSRVCLESSLSSTPVLVFQALVCCLSSQLSDFQFFRSGLPL